MTQTTSRIPGQRSSTRSPGFVYLYRTYRVDRNGLPTTGVEDGYVGQSFRKPGVRDGEHRRGAGGDPTKISPWEDLIVPGSPVILAADLEPGPELDAAEEQHIRTLRPRYNDRGSDRPDKVRKIEARRHRDNRDLARGLEPRQWPPLRVDPTVVPPPSRWRVVWRVLRLPVTWLLIAWFVVSAAILTAAVEVGVTRVVPLVAVSSLAGAAVVAVAWISGRRRVRRVWRRWKRSLW